MLIEFLVFCFGRVGSWLVVSEKSKTFCTSGVTINEKSASSLARQRGIGHRDIGIEQHRRN